ncbi:TIGR01440 family protein [Alicyclobacillus tolerans]|uniref:TIGR01440 family protein n=1 Tax=Alicyclobacillus tolerans TaxID=90970 RepID=UPI001F3E12E5|nr:TIGR01440 family protein [Alicyclobacillus tolerans]MCF8567143.1 TIGR01440 family protein [Alicyclobacillus tolerans]
MQVSIAQVREQIAQCLTDLADEAQLGSGHLLVVGASTSEIVGQRIGKATSLEVGQAVVETVLEISRQRGFEVAFQCCEHLNRALVVPRALAVRKGWTQVLAVPVPGAGGAVAAHAYFAINDACLVESIAADAGIDIGDTFIGMHLRKVAVPVRGRIREVGEAHVTMARTRPPLTGGHRAVYDVEEARRRIFPAPSADPS